MRGGEGHLAAVTRAFQSRPTVLEGRENRALPTTCTARRSVLKKKAARAAPSSTTS